MAFKHPLINVRVKMRNCCRLRSIYTSENQKMIGDSDLNR
jgi:hypothetical protein